LTDTVSIEEARSTLADLVGRAERGEEIVISRHGAPVAKLVAVAAAAPAPQGPERRRLGWARHLVIPPELLEPLPEDMVDMFYDGGPDDPLNGPPDGKPG
jgi:prevent-host-death family protein